MIDTPSRSHGKKAPLPGLSFRSRLHAGSAAGSNGQRVALLVAHTRRHVGTAVAGEAVHRVGHGGVVHNRVFPAVWSQHLMGGDASQIEGAHGAEFELVIASVTPATVVDRPGAFGLEGARGRGGIGEGGGDVGPVSLVVDIQAGGGLVSVSRGCCYPAARHGNRQVVFLLVEVAGSHVDANVAGAVVASIVERGV